MKWIVLAILVVIVPYTVISLKYRRPQPAFEPYHDLKKEAILHRLKTGGIRHVPMVVEGTEGTKGTEATKGTEGIGAPSAGGLPGFLAEALIDPPALAVSISGAHAASSIAAGEVYRVSFSYVPPDSKSQLEGAVLYEYAGSVFLVPHFRSRPDAPASSGERAVRFTVPANTLKPGSYEITLPASQQSQSWRLEVRDQK